MILANRNKHLQLSYDIKGIKIPSRFFLAPINTGFAREGSPTEELIKFHSERSGKNIGISYVGNVAIGKEFVTNDRTLYFSNSDSGSWKELTQEIDKQGSLPGIQIACSVEQKPFSKLWIEKNLEAYVKATQLELSSIPEKYLKKIVCSFVESAKIAFTYGFKVIQIHAAHGYFLSKFTNSLLNVRNDLYGNNRYFILELIVEKIRKQIPEAILDIRISLLDGLQAETVEIAEKSKFIQKLVELNVDMISVVNGMYGVNRKLMYPATHDGHGVYIPKLLPFVDSYPDRLWNVAGNIWDLDKIDSSLHRNISFSIARSLIADPYFVEKSIYHGRDLIHSCVRSGKCHYYTLEKPHVACPVYDKFYRQDSKL
jgi:2,4-dienoyl-CoA reductase-like NADH-dependent reductase (Old Yellow Enzyme family)